ncbi:zinc-dependent metalloprotease [Pinibacter soli]|uniref:Zinc-dependent metalloprotease n=1 Tax=Pinibacter soli TaxID=3044211 RepID=A0ABT6RGB6_9BACT|nr:zinc-dependent metalloprotease [Pinibacter soli]MDI3321605.1 zinc-dependent metalloprotease [Pinibacter soli]
MRGLFLWVVILPALCIPFSRIAAQNTCGFDEVNRKLQKDNSQYKKVNEKFKTQSGSKTLGSVGGGGTPGVIYKIPVVVHVIHNGEAVGVGSNISDAQVISAITYLTKYYRAQLGNSTDAGIEFELAKIDPSCQATTGIDRLDGSSVNGYLQNGITNSAFPGYQNELDVKKLGNWNNANYCNIWVVSEINGNDGGAGTQGFTYLPGAPSGIDGLVIVCTAFGYDPDGTLGFNLKAGTRQNKIVTHEMGHELGLYHSFEGDDANFDGIPDRCPPNVDCTVDGDGVCDTWPHERSRSDCPYVPYGNCSPDNSVVKNYMDYSAEDCQDRFTPGQVAKMRAAILEFRPTLVQSRALNPIIFPGGAVPITGARCTPATNTIGLSGYYAGITNVTINDRCFISGSAKDDNPLSGYLNAASGCLNIISLTKGSTNTFSITVLGEEEEQVRAWIDFNNDGIFDNESEQICIDTRIDIAPNSIVSGTFTVPQQAIENVVVRMRVMDDLSSYSGFPVRDINSACNDPVYGQAEDYPVMITSVLPVQLLSFAAKEKGNDVVVTWTTTREIDNKGFELQRSFDGTNFTAVGFVKATQQNAEQHHYSFTDFNIAQRELYYRLNQIDIDGESTLSNVVVLKRSEVNVQNGFALLGNPVSDNVAFAIKGRAQSVLTATLLDISGRQVAQWKSKQSGGSYQFDIRDKNLQSGMYILVVHTKDQQYVTKILKQ